MFLWRNVGDHPSGAAQPFHNRCQSTLKLLWWLRVAQSPAKTLLMCSSFWLHLSPDLTHLSPYLSPASSLHLPPGSASCEGARLSVCVCLCLSAFLQRVGVDCMYKQPVGGKKMRQVVQELWSICSLQKAQLCSPL